MEMEGCIGLAGNHESIVTNELSPRCQKVFHGMTLFVQIGMESFVAVNNITVFGQRGIAGKGFPFLVSVVRNCKQN
jgi:hypothetical protein